jgi:hypothetical protein
MKGFTKFATWNASTKSIIHLSTLMSVLRGATTLSCQERTAR